MKTKIFALIISILCLSMIFVACDQACEHVDADSNGVCDNCEAIIENGTGNETETGIETETEAPCAGHKDADADKVCDACGKAVVTVVEYVSGEQEERVEMVVNGIPSTSADEYVNSTIENEYFKANSSIKIEGEILNRNYAPYIHTVETATDEETATITVTHKVIDISTVDAATGYFKVLWTGTNSTSAPDAMTTKVTYSVRMGRGWYIPVKTTEVTTVETVTTIEYQAYTFANKAMGQAQTYTYANMDEYSSLNFVYPSDDKTLGTDAYVTYDDVTYVISLETFDIVNSGAYGTVADRIQVETTQGNYGYIKGTNGELYIYDLTKWNEMVYLYKPESRYNDAKYFILQNGNVLMTAYVRLPDGSVSYDYVSGGQKFDLVYIMINPAEKTATPVEFGYKIVSLAPVGEGYKDAAANYNVAVVSPVVDGYINTNIQYRLLVDNDLKVICELKNDGTLVANGLYVKRTAFHNGESANELIDVNGKHIRYIGDSYGVGYIQVGNKFYNYNNELVIDLDEYDSYQNYYGYYILTKNVNNAQEGEPENIQVQTWIYVPGQFVARLDNGDQTGWSIQYYAGYYMETYYVTEIGDMGETQVKISKLCTLDGSVFFTVRGEEILNVYAVAEDVIEVVTNAARYVVQ